MASNDLSTIHKTNPMLTEGDLEQIRQEDALFPWLADDSMGDPAQCDPEEPIEFETDESMEDQ